jgi:hypothetical protein
LSHSTRPFRFLIGSLMFCPGWPWTAIFLISASQIARITGVSHSTWFSIIIPSFISLISNLCPLSLSLPGGLLILLIFRKKEFLALLLFSSNIMNFCSSVFFYYYFFSSAYMAFHLLFFF